MEKATRQYTKEHNRNLVLKIIFSHETISRAEIARISSLTRTTVSDIVADLMDEGLVNEVGVGESQGSQGGKNPILLSLVDDSRWLIGLDLGQNEFRGAVVNLRGKIREVVSVPVNDLDGIESLTLIYQMLDKLIGGNKQALSGIGVGAPGLINTAEGMVVNAVNLNWKNIPLTSLLSERYQLPVSIMNDCQAAALGEKTYGKSFQKDENLVLVNVHHGIGAGVIINGSIFQGDGGFAGEIGHVVVKREEGELCRCGNRGCLETVASTQALIRQACSMISMYPQSLIPQEPHNITLDSIDKAFKMGDPLAQNLVLDTAHYIAMAISMVVSVVNIHRIVLNGNMTRFGNPWLDRIRAETRNYSLERPLKNTHIEIGQLGQNATIVGAAAVFANNYSYLFNR
jgi:glucokinase-like ROK family protein